MVKILHNFIHIEGEFTLLRMHSTIHEYSSKIIVIAARQIDFHLYENSLSQLL